MTLYTTYMEEPILLKSYQHILQLSLNTFAHTHICAENLLADLIIKFMQVAC